MHVVRDYASDLTKNPTISQAELDTDIHGASDSDLETRARNAARDGDSIETAYYIQRSGMRRREARQLMRRVVTISLASNQADVDHYGDMLYTFDPDDPDSHQQLQLYIYESDYETSKALVDEDKKALKKLRRSPGRILDLIF